MLWWGGGNVAAGLLTWVVPWDVVAGMLLQALLWGAIDAALGLVALRGKKDLPVAKVKKTFLVNAVLDVGYVFAGVAVMLAAITGVLALPGGASMAFGIGTGTGIAIQGAFLLVVDVVHHRHLGRMMASEPRGGKGT